VVSSNIFVGNHLLSITTMQKLLKLALFTCFLVSSIAYDISAQDKEKVIQTFRHSRIINSHSIETLPAGKLDFRIVHRFGDLAGANGGWPTFYGLENAADVSIGFEYGITDRIMAGIYRAKGAGPLRQNIHTFVKARIMSQDKVGGTPVSISVISMLSTSTMQKSDREDVLNFFARGTHRLTSHFGLHIARKFSDRISAQFNAQWTYRNVVFEGDENDLVSIGGGIRAQMSKSLAILGDVTFPLLSDLRTTDNDYYPSIGIGFEFDTSGGHVFQINLTNSQGIAETDYIPYTRSSWGEGEFRLGFTISRLFSI